MRRVLDLPLLVILIGIGALAMLVPAAHAGALGEWRVARIFFYSSVLFLFLAVLLGIATATLRPRRLARFQLISLVGAYLVLPLMLAVPVQETLRATSFLNAWFEMVSSFTTTGATVYEDAARLGPTLELWRALVGWLGGFLTWVAAVALLAPMNLGGFEVSSDEGAGQGSAAGQGFRPRESGARLVGTALSLLPVYAGLTGLLWLLLILAGSNATPALIHAMATLSTSGLTASGGIAQSGAGFAGEVAVALFLVFALSRVCFTNLTHPGLSQRLLADHELRLGLFIVAVVPAFMFLRHWLGAAESGAGTDIFIAARALWGSVFTVLSFLTTTGFVSAEWADARGWSGLEAPGVLLLGLAVIGGGVATTAGGVKLLRVWALYTHSAREMERLVHPNSIGGAGQTARRLRRQGAEIAWIFFMLFAISIALVSGALALDGLDFETAMVLTVATLSTTGPLIEIGAEAAISLPALGSETKVILMGAMVLGRLETLALIVLFNPDFWRS